MRSSSKDVPGPPVAAGHLLIKKEQLVFSEPTSLQRFHFIKCLNMLFFPL